MTPETALHRGSGPIRTNCDAGESERPHSEPRPAMASTKHYHIRDYRFHSLDAAHGVPDTANSSGEKNSELTGTGVSGPGTDPACRRSSYMRPSEMHRISTPRFGIIELAGTHGHGATATMASISISHSGTPRACTPANTHAVSGHSAPNTSRPALKIGSIRSGVCRTT